MITDVIINVGLLFVAKENNSSVQKTPPEQLMGPIF